jgi:Protein phosphatase 2C
VPHQSLTAIGSNHVAVNKPCQDSALTFEVGDAICLVVADGAGSARFSDIGSAVAVDMAQRAVSQALATVPSSIFDLASAVRLAFTNARHLYLDEIGRRMTRSQARVEDFSTTLGITICRWPHVVFAAVGDAFLVIVDDEGTPFLVAPPDKPGEYRVQTEFIHSQGEPRVELIEDAGLTAVVLSTDGLEKFIEERVVPRDGQPVITPWAPSRSFVGLVSELRKGTSPHEVSAILASPEFQQRKGDDMGVAVAWR